ncbi:neural cell adhesion molecule L1, partial [Biomphalaria glabrata]
WTFFRKDSNMVGFPNFTFHDQVFNVAYFNFSSMSKEEQASILGFYLLNISHKYEYKLISIEVIEKSKLPEP